MSPPAFLLLAAFSHHWRCISEPAMGTVGFAQLAHGFPHEICVDGRNGAIFAAAVDAADLPPSAGIGALTKYLPASV